MFENKNPVPLESPDLNDIPQGVKGFIEGSACPMSFIKS